MIDFQDDDAWFKGALVACYPSLLRFAQRLAGKGPDACDLVQDTIERALRCRRGFQHGDTPQRWLTTILRRLFIDRCRRARLIGQKEAPCSIDELAAPETCEPRRPWEGYDVEDIRRAATSLERPFLVPFAMFVFDRLPYREIGRRLGLPPGTVATRVFRARRKVREILESGAPGATVSVSASNRRSVRAAWPPRSDAPGALRKVG